MDDKMIIELFFARSESAIAALAEKYGRQCHLVAANILNNEQDAEECCHKRNTNRIDKGIYRLRLCDKLLKIYERELSLIVCKGEDYNQNHRQSDKYAEEDGIRQCPGRATREIVEYVTQYFHRLYLL